MSFQDDINGVDLDHMWDTGGDGYAVDVTYYADAGGADGETLAVIPIEQTFNIFDSKSNVQFLFPDDGVISPLPGDEILYLGLRFKLLQIKLEEGVWNTYGVREDVRQ